MLEFGWAENNKLVNAFAISLLVHTLILILPGLKRATLDRQSTTFLVTLLDEEIIEAQESADEPVLEPTPNNETNKVVEPDPTPDIAKNEPTTVFAKEETATVQFTTNSNLFGRWLENDTKLYREKNADALANFGNTFNDVFIKQDTPKDIKPADLPAGKAAFSVELNGRRTCYVQTFDLLDVHSGPTLVSKDCTPPKKFVLEINKPNNGWLNR